MSEGEDITSHLKNARGEMRHMKGNPHPGDGDAPEIRVSNLDIKSIDEIVIYEKKEDGEPTQPALLYVVELLNSRTRKPKTEYVAVYITNNFKEYFKEDILRWPQVQLQPRRRYDINFSHVGAFRIKDYDKFRAKLENKFEVNITEKIPQTLRLQMAIASAIKSVHRQEKKNDTYAPNWALQLYDMCPFIK